MHTEDAEPSTSVDHISSDEHIVFLNEGELQNGLHEKEEGELPANGEVQPAMDVPGNQNHHMVNGEDGVVMQMADGLEILIPQVCCACVSLGKCYVI